MSPALFDRAAFAARLNAAMGRRGATCRSVADAAKVSASTVSRAANAVDRLDVENWLKLECWIDPHGFELVARAITCLGRRDAA